MFRFGVKHNNMYNFLIFLILMATFSAISDYLLAVLQELNLWYMRCSYVVWDHIIHKYLHNISYDFLLIDGTSFTSLGSHTA
jgi:hypothetical protein